MSKTVCVPVSIGELLDKITILNIKRVMVSDLEKVANVKRELMELMDMGSTFLSQPKVEELYDRLMVVNKNLWDVEDQLRKMELEKKFDEDFILKARSVYQLNDRRYQIKNEINILLGSDILEVKQYVDYQ
jgi:hypothetical protein